MTTRKRAPKSMSKSELVEFAESVLEACKEGSGEPLDADGMVEAAAELPGILLDYRLVTDDEKRCMTTTYAEWDE